MPLTNYYVLKGTSKKIYTALCNNERIDSRVFDIWLQAMAWSIKNDRLNKNDIPTEVNMLFAYLKSAYRNNAHKEQGFDFGAIYGSLQLLGKAKGT